MNTAMASGHCNPTRTQRVLVDLFPNQDMYFFATSALAILILILGPVTIATQQGDTNARQLRSLLIGTVQDLRSVEELVHQVILPQLRRQLVSSGLPQGSRSCAVDYPYAPEKNGGRLTDDVETLAKLLPRLRRAAAFESTNRGGLTRVLMSTAVSKLERVVTKYHAVMLAVNAEEQRSSAAKRSTYSLIFGRILPHGQKNPVPSTPSPLAPPTPCSPLVTSALQQYETLLQVYIALVYATRDAVAVNNYYNSQ